MLRKVVEHHLYQEVDDDSRVDVHHKRIFICQYPHCHGLKESRFLQGELLDFEFVEVYERPFFILLFHHSSFELEGLYSVWKLEVVPEVLLQVVKQNISSSSYESFSCSADQQCVVLYTAPPLTNWWFVLRCARDGWVVSRFLLLHCFRCVGSFDHISRLLGV